MPSYDATPSVPPVLPTSQSLSANVLDREGKWLDRALSSCVSTGTEMFGPSRKH